MKIELMRCKHGHFFFPAHDSIVGRSLQDYGEYSEHEVELFNQILRPGDVALDLGANLGALTIPMGRRVGPTGRVWAFEPQPAMARILAANCIINTINVKVMMLAAGDTKTQVSIPDFEDYNHVYNYGRVEVGEPGFSKYVMVSQEPLDELDIDEPVRFMKVDVEGSELRVLRGAKTLIETNKPIMFVENDRLEHVDELIHYVRDIGYTLYWHIAPLYNADNFRKNPENIFGGQASFNMLCAPQAGPNTMEVSGLHEVDKESIEMVKTCL